MAEVIGLAASVAGLVTAAVQSTDLLASTIRNIRDAPDAIRGIDYELKALRPVLSELDKTVQKDTSVILGNEISVVLANCDRVCTKFGDKLAHWTRHSTDQDTSKRDRWSIGLLKQGSMETIRAQLRNSRETLGTTLQTATYLTMSTQAFMPKEMIEQTLKNFEVNLQQTMVQMTSERAALDLQEQAVAQASGAHEETSDLLEELRQQRATTEALLKTCEEALKRTTNRPSEQKIRGIKSTNYGTALAGVINSSGQEVTVQQDISDVSADTHGLSLAGVVNNLDFSTLRR